MECTFHKQVINLDRFSHYPESSEFYNSNLVFFGDILPNGALIKRAKRQHTFFLPSTPAHVFPHHLFLAPFFVIICSSQQQQQMPVVSGQSRRRNRSVFGTDCAAIGPLKDHVTRPDMVCVRACSAVSVGGAFFRQRGLPPLARQHCCCCWQS